MIIWEESGQCQFKFSISRGDKTYTVVNIHLKSFEKDLLFTFRRRQFTQYNRRLIMCLGSYNHLTAKRRTLACIIPWRVHWYAWNPTISQYLTAVVIQFYLEPLLCKGHDMHGTWCQVHVMAWCLRHFMHCIIQHSVFVGWHRCRTHCIHNMRK